MNQNNFTECTSCHRQIPANSNFCPYCGKKQIVHQHKPDDMPEKYLKEIKSDPQLKDIYGKASVNNDPEAQCSLGIAFYNGEGITQDPKEAAKWFQKSADQGYQASIDAMGQIHRNGIA